MLVLDYYVTPANVHDASALPPLLDDMEENGLLGHIDDIYGDNAYNTTENANALKKDGRNIGNQIHTKAETGKHPQNPRSAKAKSKVRSKVECLYGILSENYAWGQLHVRTFSRVQIAIGSVFIAWNFFFAMAYIMEEPEYCRSLRQFLYENSFKEGEMN